MTYQSGKKYSAIRSNQLRAKKCERIVALLKTVSSYSSNADTLSFVIEDLLNDKLSSIDHSTEVVRQKYISVIGMCLDRVVDELSECQNKQYYFVKNNENNSDKEQYVKKARHLYLKIGGVIDEFSRLILREDK